MAVKHCNNLMDFRRLAKRRLPRTIFHYLDGAADDELSCARNTAAFAEYELLPSQLSGVGSIDLSTTVLGKTIDWPVILAPTSAAKIYHRDGESAVARAAGKAGIFYSMSTISTSTIEEIGNTGEGPKIYQIYIFRDRGLTRSFVDRCKEADYDAIALTVDTPVAGNRERDLVTGLSGPRKLNPLSVLSYLRHPGWLYRALIRNDMEFVNITSDRHSSSGMEMGVMEYINSQFDPTLTWKDVDWLANEWGKPLIIKGVQTVEDCRKAADSGATAVCVSNHGGRQLESTPAPIDCIAPIADALRDRLEIICDGGIRRGNHVVKAMAEGAHACSIGRGYLYALAVGGQPAVELALALLRAEIERSMALVGCDSVAKLGRSYVAKRR